VKAIEEPSGPFLESKTNRLTTQSATEQSFRYHLLRKSLKKRKKKEIKWTG